jgi:histidinol-phosphate phosphatase family protein
MRAAIFLDKDGTVLDDIPYNVDPASMHLAPGAREALQALGRTDFPLIIISNQSGVALGKFPYAALEAVHARLAEMFAACGATLHGFHCCPHHPQGIVPDYARACDCRKPAPGLLYRAAAQHDVDLQASWFVGDILNDVEAGRRAGCRTILIDNGNETEWDLSPIRTPHVVVPDLAAAAATILGRSGAPAAMAPIGARERA